MQIPLPELSTPDIINKVMDAAGAVLGDQPVEKCLVYAPDAIGEVLFRDYSGEFEPVVRLAPVQVVLRSMFPPKTPVCFASMFTGALPEDHGIRKYEKPVLQCDTMFDALLRAKKRVAIAAVEGSSISLIFKERALSYFIEKYDQQVNSRLLQIFRDNDYDFVLAYNQEYDDALHRTTPRSDEALRAMRNHIDSFEELAEAFLKRYKDHTCLVVFSPDHGAHINEAGRGDHGLDIPEDMEVRSFWGIHDKGT
jgi:Fe-S oxidoreductase